MTSITDEIRNLRAALEDIESWCQTTALASEDPNARKIAQHLAAMARRGLRTPRASKPLTVGEVMDDLDMTGRS